MLFFDFVSLPVMTELCVQQLAGRPELDLAQQIERLKPPDDDDNQRSAHRAEELEKRMKQKKEDEIAMRKEWCEEVISTSLHLLELLFDTFGKPVFAL